MQKRNAVIAALVVGVLAGRYTGPRRVDVVTVKLPPIVVHDTVTTYRDRAIPQACRDAVEIFATVLPGDAVLTKSTGQLRLILHEAGKAIQQRDLKELNNQFDLLRRIDPEIATAVVDRAAAHNQVIQLLDACKKTLAADSDRSDD